MTTEGDGSKGGRGTPRSASPPGVPGRKGTYPTTMSSRRPDNCKSRDSTLGPGAVTSDPLPWPTLHPLPWLPGGFDKPGPVHRTSGRTSTSQRLQHRLTVANFERSRIYRTRVPGPLSGPSSVIVDTGDPPRQLSGDWVRPHGPWTGSPRTRNHRGPVGGTTPLSGALSLGQRDLSVPRSQGERPPEWRIHAWEGCMTCPRPLPVPGGGRGDRVTSESYCLVVNRFYKRPRRRRP